MTMRDPGAAGLPVRISLVELARICGAPRKALTRAAKAGFIRIDCEGRVDTNAAIHHLRTAGWPVDASLFMNRGLASEALARVWRKTVR